MLSEALWNYNIAKDNVRKTIGTSQYLPALEEQAEWTSKCVAWITKARMADLIIETESMMTKLKKTEEEKQRLKTENMNLKKLNTELSQRLNTFLPLDTRRGRTETGDLRKP